MGVIRNNIRNADSVDRVYGALKNLSMDYHFKPSKRINEVALAKRFGVSRTPIREALNRLVQDGFVSFVPNRGFYARDITPKDVHELYELRAIIEQAAFRLTCQRASDEELEAIALIWEQACEQWPDLDLVDDWTDVMEADERFHMEIAKQTKNTRLYESLESLNALSRFFRRIDLEDVERRNNAYDEHVLIIKALRERDIEQGCRILDTHVSSSSQHAVSVTKEGLAKIFVEDMNLGQNRQ